MNILSYCLYYPFHGVVGSLGPCLEGIVRAYFILQNVLISMAKHVTSTIDSLSWRAIMVKFWMNLNKPLFILSIVKVERYVDLDHGKSFSNQLLHPSRNATQILPYHCGPRALSQKHRDLDHHVHRAGRTSRPDVTSSCSVQRSMYLQSEETRIDSWCAPFPCYLIYPASIM